MNRRQQDFGSRADEDLHVPQIVKPFEWEETAERTRAFSQLARDERRNRRLLNWSQFWADIRRDAFCYLFLAPFLICFIVFIVIPVVMAATLGFTSYDGFGSFILSALNNYIALFTQDIIFLTKAIPNTFLFALIVGPGGYILAFLFAWLIHQLPIKIRDYYTLAFYAPSMAGAVALSVVWIAAFSGDRVGYVNNFLLDMGWIEVRSFGCRTRNI